ncbi:MAG: hypothetical protein LBC98_10605 [Prevotellaceae bacterium]|jgi:hypothetical protein|nr:hypothetical protein [Prevotellaceae bacterium]
MENVMEYILNLGGNLDDKLRRIGINNDQQLDTWARVQQQVLAADRTMANMGRSMGSLQQRIAALRAQREWIPAENREAIRQSNREIRDLERQIRDLENLNGGRLSQWFRELGQQIPLLNLWKNPLVHAAMSVRKLTQYMGEGREMYKQQMEAETKLAAVMRNTIGVENGEVEAILRLTSAQQKLGVIGDEVQLSGAQELATYVTKKESIEGLIPVMNDMLAQQYGLNASQEQAQNIAMMLGKVMNGQVGALSRYGYKFDDAQEKILKHGSESKRLAVLIDVVSESVGGVNAALAATPEGKLKQMANNAGDLQERVGKLAGLAQSAFSPVAEKIQALIDSVISFFEKHMTTIRQVIGTAADAFLGLFSTMKTLAPYVGFMGIVWLAYSIKLKGVAWWTKMAEMATTKFSGALKFLKHPLGYLSLAATVIVGAYQAVKAFNSVQGRFAELTGGVAAKIGVEQRELNRLFTLLKNNKDTDVRASIIAEIQEKYPDFIGNINLETASEEELEKARKKANDELARSIALQSLKETSQGAQEKIVAAEQKLWEHLSGDYTDAQINAGIDKVKSVVDEKIKSGKFTSGMISSGASNILIDQVMREAFGSAGHSMWGEKFNAPGSAGKWRDMINDMLENQQKVHVLEQFLGGRYGITDEQIIGATGVNSALASAVNGNKTNPKGDGSTDSTNEAIATGGKRNTVINITIGDLIKEINFNGGFGENRDAVQRDLAQAIMQVLGMAETAAG